MTLPKAILHMLVILLIGEVLGKATGSDPYHYIAITALLIALRGEPA